MKIVALLILALLIAPVSALSPDEIDTSDLDMPEIDDLDLSGNPIGSLDALEAYVNRLVTAAEELLNFIESIFEMLGMEEDEDVKKLLSVLDEGMDMSGRK